MNDLNAEDFIWEKKKNGEKFEFFAGRIAENLSSTFSTVVKIVGTK